MSDRQLSLMIGFSPDYFAMMKHTNIDKYNYIFSFDKDKRKSLLKYIDYIQNLSFKIEDILNTVENKTAYGIILISNKLSKNKNPTSVYNNSDKAVFKIRESKNWLTINLKTVKKWEKIIPLFN